MSDYESEMNEFPYLEPMEKLDHRKYETLLERLSGRASSPRRLDHQ